MARKKASAGAGAEPDEKVESALFQRACGMEYEEVSEKETIDRKTGEREVLVTRTKKYLPPDPRSAMFWLTNRQAGRWQLQPRTDTQEEETGGVIVLPEVLDEKETESE